MFVTIAPEECQFEIIKNNVTEYYRVNVLKGKPSQWLKSSQADKTLSICCDLVW